MFRGTYFRLSKTKTTKFTVPSDNKVANHKLATRNGCLSESSSHLIQSTSLKRLIIALTTIRVSSSSTSTTVTTTTTSASSLGALLKSFLVGFYYIIAFTSLLILILYLNRFASENLQNQARADARGGLMLSSTWPGMVAILSSAEMAANTMNKHHHEHLYNNNNNSSSRAYLIRIRRSLARDGRNDSNKDKNSSSISSQANHSKDPSQLAMGEQHAGKTSTRRVNNQRNKFNFRAATINATRPVSSNLHQPEQLQMVNPNSIGPKEELELMSTFELQRRVPSTRSKGNQHQQQPLSRQTPLAASSNAAMGRALPSVSSRAPVSLELTERQASYSANNRGSIGSSNSTKPELLKNQSPRGPRPQAGQWIPILSEPSVERPSRQHPQVASRAPQRAARPMSPPVSAISGLESAASIYRPTESTPPERVPLNVVPSPSSLSRQRQHHNYHHDHPAHQHRPNRHWRRPRFNILQPDMVPTRPAKMYKRVLLCDKTLVSLDYVKRGHHLPFEAHFELEDDHDFDDNIIDLDSNLDQIYAPLDNSSNNRRAANATHKPPINPGSEHQTNNLLHASESAPSGELLVEVERRSYLNDDDPLVKCDMWDLEKGLKNRKPPREILQMAMKADFDTVRDAINRCRQLSEKILPPDDEYRDGIVEIMSTEDLVSLFSMKRGLLPGTKWCGLGDQASSYNDLGPKHRIDICCRAHDHCPIRLKPFRNDYGVLNIGLYTKSHCDCDADFYRCLREAHSRTADMLGNLYFNVMKLQCMREERMKICREMKPIALGFERCIRYEESPVKTVFKFTTPPVAY